MEGGLGRLGPAEALILLGKQREEFTAEVEVELQFPGKSRKTDRCVVGGRLGIGGKWLWIHGLFT
jgi:hypothetical protein